MPEKITSPEQLNRMMNVSGKRVWIMLALILGVLALGIFWFLNHEVVISEQYPCYVSEEKTTMDRFLYEIYREEMGDEEQAKAAIDGLIESYGRDYVVRDVYPAYIFVDDIQNTELISEMKIKVGDHNGTVAHMPTETFDFSEFQADRTFTEKEMREAGLNPGVEYSPVLVAIWADENNGSIRSGLYRASVIIDVLKPVTMLLNR